MPSEARPRHLDAIQADTFPKCVSEELLAEQKGAEEDCQPEQSNDDVVEAKLKLN